VKTTISTKGQVTIPKHLRDRLGLRPGTALEFSEENGRLVARKAETDRDPVAAVTGILNSLDVDTYLEETRGPAE